MATPHLLSRCPACCWPWSLTLQSIATQPGPVRHWPRHLAKSWQPVSHWHYGQALFLEDGPSRFSEGFQSVSTHVLSMDRNHFAQHCDTRRGFILSDSRRVPSGEHRVVRRHGLDGRLERAWDRSAARPGCRSAISISALEVGGI